jgi:uncharacterized protein YndB with AHSA1/START domain
MKTKSKGKPTVVVKKVIAADRARVFDAWTKPELMKHWYIGSKKGSAKCTVDLRVGGSYTNEMLIENGNSVKSYMHSGEYLEIIPLERLVFTWNSAGVQNTTVTVELRDVSGGTEVTITHELPAEEDCPDHQEGWTHALSNLASYLA